MRGGLKRERRYIRKSVGAIYRMLVKFLQNTEFSCHAENLGPPILQSEVQQNSCNKVSSYIKKVRELRLYLVFHA